MNATLKSTTDKMGKIYLPYLKKTKFLDQRTKVSENWAKISDFFQYST